jgi:hypothetical protein
MMIPVLIFASGRVWPIAGDGWFHAISVTMTAASTLIFALKLGRNLGEKMAKTQTFTNHSRQH